MFSKLFTSPPKKQQWHFFVHTFLLRNTDYAFSIIVYAFNDTISFFLFFHCVKKIVPPIHQKTKSTEQRINCFLLSHKINNFHFDAQKKTCYLFEISPSIFLKGRLLLGAPQVPSTENKSTWKFWNCWIFQLSLLNFISIIL